MAEADPQFNRSVECPSGTDQGHILRSQLLDAFSIVESSLCDLAIRFELDGKTNLPLGQRVKAVRDSEIPGIKNKTGFKALMNELTQCADVRSGLVHSKMEVAVIQGQPGWIFRTVPHSSKNAKIITEIEFVEMIRHIKHLANRLRQYTQPAPTDPAATSAAASAH
jgi:hypothetical protein